MEHAIMNWRGALLLSTIGSLGGSWAACDGALASGAPCGPDDSWSVTRTVYRRALFVDGKLVARNCQFSFSAMLDATLDVSVATGTTMTESYSYNTLTESAPVCATQQSAMSDPEFWCAAVDANTYTMLPMAWVATCVTPIDSNPPLTSVAPTDAGAESGVDTWVVAHSGAMRLSASPNCLAWLGDAGTAPFVWTDVNVVTP
ncbi:MAG: hypothetical protein ACHREM_09520 [Polyangiales bacterium]